MNEAQLRFWAIEAFPDLEEVKDRWGIVRLATNTVNEKAFKFEVHNECECCNGVKVYALPYLDFEGIEGIGLECIRLYSKTPAISFAKRFKAKDNFTYCANDNWDESKKWENFNGLLLDKVAEWLDAHNADSFYGDDNDETT